MTTRIAQQKQVETCRTSTGQSSRVGIPGPSVIAPLSNVVRRSGQSGRYWWLSEVLPVSPVRPITRSSIRQ